MVTKIKIGNILESNAQTLVNTVNTVGIMGKGIALDFKKRFPEMFKEYEIKCQRGEVKLGQPYIFQTLVGPYVINFPTKEHWRSVSKIKDIENGLNYLINHIEKWNVESLAVPPLGCGNGQLEWEEVGPVIYRYLNTLAIPVEIYAPFGTPARQLTKEFLEQASEIRANEWSLKDSKFNPNWLVLIEILHELEKHPYHEPVGRTIFQKIAYVVTEQGVAIGFNFQQKSYGPFSIEIKKAITILANNNLIREYQKGKMFQLKVGPSFENVRARHQNLIDKNKKIIEKTADLFARMTTNQAEIATTIFYSARMLKKGNGTKEISEKDVFNYVMEWKQKHRPPLDKREVATAIRNLAILNWVKVKYSDNLPVYEEV